MKSSSAKFSLKKTLFIIFILSSLLFATYYFLKPKTIVQNNNTAVRNDFLTPKESTTFERVDFAKYEALISQINKSFVISDYWATWQYKQNIIFADILAVFPDTKELTIKIVKPADQLFSNKSVRVGVSCTRQTSFTIDKKNNKYLKGNIDLFSQASLRDHLYTQCLDAACLNVGNICALIEDN